LKAGDKLQFKLTIAAEDSQVDIIGLTPGGADDIPNRTYRIVMTLVDPVV
jgi:hypothetical protein